MRQYLKALLVLGAVVCAAPPVFALGYLGIGGGSGRAGDANANYQAVQLSLGGAKDQNEGFIAMTGGDLGDDPSKTKLAIYQLGVRRHFGTIQNPWIGTSLTYFDSKNESVVKSGLGIPFEIGGDAMLGERFSLGMMGSFYPFRSFYTILIQLKFWGKAGE